MALSIAAGACGPANSGVPGSPAVSRPAVTGTVFTIVFENHDEGQVMNSSMPYLVGLSQQFGRARAYVSSTHPSLPNYIQMTSGQTNGIGDDNDPTAHQVAGSQNLAAQLDAAGVPWRAYMESMGEPCNMTSTGTYSAHHDPFLYYTSLTADPARCQDHVVDFDQHFAADLAANQYRYMWITPNMCNDMHDCPPQTTDAWLARVIPQIMASPGYTNGGAIFILFDEGSVRFFGAAADLATVVVSPNIVAPGFQSNTAYNHESYLATIEDVFNMPRLATTTGATPMSEFFATGLTSPTATTGTSTAVPLPSAGITTTMPAP